MRITLVLAFILVQFRASAQFNIYPERLTDSTNNYLYIGVDNPVRIAGVSNEHVVSISGGGATLTRVSKEKFIVRVSSLTDNCAISITKQGPGKILASKEFYVRHIPEPQLNWVSGITTSRDSLLKMPFLSIELPGCYFKLNYEIISFTASIDHGDSVLSFPITGHQFSAAFTHHLQTEKTGKLLTFDNIRVLGPDGRSRKVPSIILYLQ
jgi:hypothetical protein